MKEIIRFEDVRYSYIAEQDDVHAVNGVSLAVEKGEFVAFVGHNGSGKSTLAKLINALLTPSKGNVYVDGMDTSDEKLIYEIRRLAGLVFQNPDNQLVASVVEEDVAFGPENLGVEPSEIRKRVDAALANLGMSEFALSAPHLLSGGQKQRVAIAGILAMKPDVLVLDEPTAMLDPSGQREVMEAVLRLNRDEGITVVHITHEMSEALLADRVFVMSEGKVACTGTPRELFADAERLREYGLDVPRMARLSDMLRERGVSLPDGIMDIEGMVAALCR